MKKPYIKSVAVLAISLGLYSCGDDVISSSYKVSEAEEMALQDFEKKLKRLKKDPGYIDSFNYSMEKAAQEGYAKAVKAYLDNGADPNSKGIFGNNNNIINRVKHQEVIKVLCAAGADAKGVRAWSEDKKTLEMLIKAGADVNKGTPLLEAIRQNKKEIIEILLKAGADVNKEDSKETPLLVAIRDDKKEIIEILLKAGADVNKRAGSRNETPLFFAYREDKKEIIEMLIKAGADVNKKNKGGDTLLHCAIEEDKNEIAKMLINAGADVNEGNSHETPLLEAIWDDKKEIVEMLIKAGADVNKKDYWDKSPLRVAEKNGNLDIIELLKKKGAK